MDPRECEDMKAKQAAAGQYQTQGIGAGVVGGPGSIDYGYQTGNLAAEPFTLRGEAEYKIGYYRDQAERADQAAAFFRENPAFDQFIRLIRSGVIHI